MNMSAATIILLETDTAARANNAQADLYQCLKTYADARDLQGLITTLDVHYLTVDKKGIYNNPVTGNSQMGMVVHFDRDMRDRAMMKAANFGEVPRQFSELYYRLKYEPSIDTLREARVLIRSTFAAIWQVENEETALANVINF
jgi:hypothetical protein